MAEQPSKPQSAPPSGQGPGAVQAKSQEQVAHHVARRKKRTRDPARMSLNFTAMIDVVFQLLIYFIVTASFTIGEGIITAKFPQGTGAQPAEEPPEKPLKIRLASYGDAGYRIVLEGFEAPSNFKALREALIGLQFDPAKGRGGAYKPDNPLVISPDGHVRWTHVVNAFNAAVAAGYSNVAFAQAQLEE
jgi:biopolymer transport protein ExbD